MMVDSLYSFPEIYQKNFYHFFMGGGYGDIVMGLPVFKWAQDNEFKNKFIVMVPQTCEFFYKEVLGDRVYPANQKIVWGKHSKVIMPYNYRIFARTNLSKLFSISAFGRALKGKDLELPRLSKKFPTQNILYNMGLGNESSFFDLVNKSVTIATSYRSRAKSWNNRTLKNFIMYLTNEKKYNVILVGGKNEEYKQKIDPQCSKSVSKNDLFLENNNRIFDLVGKLSMEETFIVIQHSKYFVGITGGLVQVSALSGVPILCLISYTDIYHSLYWRDGIFGGNTWVVVPDDNKCKFCIDNFFVTGIDYNSCIKKKNFECRDYDLDMIIEKFTEMENGISCRTLEKFRNNELPNFDFD